MHYVVRRPFKNYGKVLLPGTFVEPTSVKCFKRRLREKVIVEVTKDTFNAWNAYFKAKLNVTLEWPADKPEEVTTEVTGAEEVAPEEPPSEGNEQAAEKPKVVVSANPK